MIATLLTVCGWVLAVGLVLFIAISILSAWGGLAFQELPLFSAGDEPTNVRRLPEIDIPLDPKED